MKKVLSFLIIVLVLALSISLVSCNNQNDPNAQKPNSDYEAQIEALQKIIEELQQGLISAEEAIKQLEDASANIKDWNDASVALSDKIAEINRVTEEFKESVAVYDEKDENKEYPLVTFNDLYNFSYFNGNETIFHADQFAELQYNAIMELYRAISVAEMDTIIGNYKEALRNVPTVLELYIYTLETVEKDGKVTYDEYETIKLAYTFASLITNEYIYSPAAAGEEKGQKELLAERLDALMTDFKPLVVANFVELVSGLPRLELLTPSHYEEIEEVASEAAFVIELYGVNEAKKLETNLKGKLTAYGKAVQEFAEVEARVAVIKSIEAHAKDLNEFLAKAFDKETLKAANVKYGANIETYNYLAYVGKQIETWIEKREIVTDEKDEAYNAELYNLVNYSVYEGYIDMFEAEVATLRAAANAFIAAVEAIENVNLDSKATLDAAKVLFDVVAKGQKIADLDTILGLNDYVDDEGENVEVTSLDEAYDAWLNQYARYNWLTATKKALEDAAKATLVKCEDATHGKKDANGDIVVCDCENLGTYDYTKFVGDFDDAIVRIIAEYGLGETVFDAELLTVYKMARLQAPLYEVLDRVEVAYHNSAMDAKATTLKAIIIEEIKAVAANYTFAAEYTCVDPDNKDHECDCAENLANWALVIENDPAEALAEKYTAEILADRFN